MNKYERKIIDSLNLKDKRGRKVQDQINAFLDMIRGFKYDDLNGYYSNKRIYRAVETENGDVYITGSFYKIKRFARNQYLKTGKGIIKDPGTQIVIFQY